MKFKHFLNHVNNLKDNCLVKCYELDNLEVYITRSNGEIIFGVMDGEQNIIDYFKWEGCL